jgi:hypothetical protein
MWCTFRDRVAGRVGLLLFLLAGCSPPGGICRRAVASGSLVRQAWAELDETKRQPLTASRTSCPGDVVSVSVRLVDPDGLEATFEQGPLSTGDFQVAATFVSFVPSKRGLYRLEATFEPSLGKDTIELEAVPAGEAGSFQRVVTRPSCTWAWALSDDVVACETFGLPLSVNSADGGFVTFEGRELVVAGNVLWSLDGEALQRREFIDGGLVLTHSALGFGRTTSVATLHTAQVALRTRTSALLGRAEVLDGGLVVSTVSQLETALFFFEEPDAGLLNWNSQYACAMPPCIDDRVVVALEPELIWIGQTVGSRVEGIDRPWSPVQRRLPRHLLDTPAVRSQPDRSAERVPLWLEASLDRGRQVLVTAQDGGLSFTAWTPSVVANVDATHVLVREGVSNAFRIYRRE